MKRPISPTTSFTKLYYIEYYIIYLTKRWTNYFVNGFPLPIMFNEKTYFQDQYNNAS